MFDDIDEVKTRVNIVDVIGERVRLKKVGSNYFGLCPFHNEKTPSFSVNEKLQIFKCFGCGAGGDVFKFLMRTDNLTFYEALKELADRVGYKLKSDSIHPKDKQYIEKKNKLLEVVKLAADFYSEKLVQNKNNPGYQYILKRGLNKDLIQTFHLGYAPENNDEIYAYFQNKSIPSELLIEAGIMVNKGGKLLSKFRNRIIFSIFDEKGNIVGFSGRFIGQSSPTFNPPKYLNSPQSIVFNKSRLIFGLFQAVESIRKYKFVILCEGQMNVLSSHRVGVKNIVASLGTSFTREHLDILKRYTNTIYLAFDKDSAGKKATIRTLELIFSYPDEITVKVISWDNQLGKDPDELIMANPEKWIESLKNPYDPIEYLISNFFKKNPNPTIDQKNSILKIILPLINKHRSEFIKQEYLKKLASDFNVRVESFESYSDEDFGQNRQDYSANRTNLSNEHANKIYDHIFGLILQNWSKAKYLLNLIDRDLIIDEYMEIFDCILLFIDAEDVTSVYHALDEENKVKFEHILLKEVTFDSNTSIEEHIRKSIPLLVRIRYQQVSQQLKLNTENKQLLDLLQKLAKYLNAKN